MPGALLVGALAALGAAVLGVVAGAVIAGQPLRIPAPLAAVAVGAVVVALLIPAPRRAGPVAGHLTLQSQGDGAVVQVTLHPPDAARHALWFEAVSWQGGGMRRSVMQPAGQGVYRSSDPMPVTGEWKTVVRLHRGAELIALPVYLPEDTKIRAPLVAAIDADRAFVSDTKLMLRETKPGPAWPRIVIYSAIAVFGLVAGAFVALAARRIHHPERREERRPLSSPAMAAR
jgi:hypothetical protein